MMFAPVCDGDAAPGFDRFYSLYLARSPGARIQSSAMREYYLDYARATGAPVLGFKTIRRLLEAKGHRVIRSNAMHFCDLMIVRRVEAEAFDPAMLTAERVLSAISAAIDDLEATRGRLVRELRATAAGQAQAGAAL